MTLSLYQVTVPGYLQTLGAVEGLLRKASAHCERTATAPETLLQARLADDMLPLAYQFTAVCNHSLGALEGVRTGVYSPITTSPPMDFAVLAQRLEQARHGLEIADAAEIDDLMGRPMRFEFGEIRIDFTAENFLLSFSQPNFYFHASTAYDILRWRGLALGKADFIGQLRTR